MAKTRQKSPLVVFEKLSPNRTKPRTSPVRGSTPHHMAGNLTIEAMLSMSRVTTYDPEKGMSPNYAIGTDGRIGLGVEETNRAWTSSSSVNDHRCITTEIANNGGDPDWRVSDAAINSWLNLTVEQCQFYGFKKVNYQEKPANITVAKVEAWIKTWAKDDEWIITLHNWFLATACPGPYFTRQLPWLVKEMNKRLTDSSYVPEAFVGEGAMATGEAIPIPPTGEASALKTIDVIANEVLAGAWGNGEERVKKLTAAGYDAAAVQAKVNELTSGAPATEFKQYEVTITASALNVRSGPGTNHKVVKTLINDKNVYTIVEEATDTSSGKWGKLKSGLGWVSLQYTKKR